AADAARVLARLDSLPARSIRLLHRHRPATYAIACSILLGGATTATTLALRPPESIRLLNESQGLLSNGQLEAAGRRLDRSLQLDAKNADAYRARGLLYLVRERWSPADEDLQMALKLAPDP